MIATWVAVLCGFCGLVAGFLLCAALSMGRLNDVEQELRRIQGSGER